jgi:hypothetical protein
MHCDGTRALCETTQSLQATEHTISSFCASFVWILTLKVSSSDGRGNLRWLYQGEAPRSTST